MKFGFAKQDITPRLGIELAGYPGQMKRYATAVRDKLWARGMAVSDGEKTAVIVSCELALAPAVITREVCRLVEKETGVGENGILVQATHTHSGPCIPTNNRNTYDESYVKVLPQKIAKAGIEAVKNMREAELSYAKVPCEGIGVNRVYEKFNYREEGLKPDFRPEKPELTDTFAHVLTVSAEDEILGFLSYFGCHNVVGGSGSTYIHGDFTGIATNRLEKEFTGSTGLFLTGAQGDVNAACCCMGNDKVLEALDIMSDRYLNSIRLGIAAGTPLVTLEKQNVLKFVRKQVTFSRREVDINTLRTKLSELEAVVNEPSTLAPILHETLLKVRALRYVIQKLENGESFENKTVIQGIRIGPLVLFATPFEVFQAIKNDVTAKASAPVPLVMSACNDDQGYAIDKVTSEDKESYAARTVPLWKYTLPYKNIHEELVQYLLELDTELFS